MSHRKRLQGLLAAAAFLAATPVHAADLDAGYADIPQPEAEQKVEFGSGWYIRGDIGVTRGLSATANDDPYNYGTLRWDTQTQNKRGKEVYEHHPAGIYLGPGQTPPTLSGTSTSRLSYTGSLGGGYQFNRWFRADAVFDFHQPTESSYRGGARECITGTVLTPGGTSELPYTADCTPTLKATLKSYDALVNGYLDLGTWNIVTPYVGAGVGLSFGHANVSSTYVMNNGVPYQITYKDALNGATYYQNWDRSASTQYYNFAFALMAGAAFDVYDHTKLDIGYRYLHLGQVLGTRLDTQEVRAGLRYMIDN